MHVLKKRLPPVSSVIAFAALIAAAGCGETRSAISEPGVPPGAATNAQPGATAYTRPEDLPGFVATGLYPSASGAAGRVSIAQDSVDFLNGYLTQTRARAARGEVTETDVALVEARLAAAEARLLAATGQLEISLVRYRGHVGESFPLDATP
ncbi:hypothetical protein Ga0609869_002087 [Rhodovulum iodosum]|uniref:DUF3035 domain-containing protein n=1 Tax=Rhodovulum iodosum TaxID=68291 RepID=A0ABV3XUG6_9RHOB|nr:TolC family protein [Rhodovulum robiginosum]RSK32171.1 hypothetical protein EJA01_13200 [Rhodovulum robiginosum]